MASTQHSRKGGVLSLQIWGWVLSLCCFLHACPQRWKSAPWRSSCKVWRAVPLPGIGGAWPLWPQCSRFQAARLGVFSPHRDRSRVEHRCFLHIANSLENTRSSTGPFLSSGGRCWAFSFAKCPPQHPCCGLGGTVCWFCVFYCPRRCFCCSFRSVLHRSEPAGRLLLTLASVCPFLSEALFFVCMSL